MSESTQPAELRPDQQQQPLEEAPTQPAELESVAHYASQLSWGDGSAPSLPSIDTDNSDTDMSDATSFRSSTMSVSSSLYQFVDENGRTYHKYKDGKYLLPNDAVEQERLDLQHHLFLVTANGKYNLAPIPETPKRVLDIATGTGIWAIEFAQQHPDTQVIGTDLSPIQPQYVPENCSFEIDDAEDEWLFSAPFDFVHARMVFTCFADPRVVMRRAYENLAPGGYLEFQDMIPILQFIGEAPPNSALKRWTELLCQGGLKAGRPWTVGQHYKSFFEEVGFTEVVERRFYWPTSPWPKGRYFKTVATYMQQDTLSGLESVSLRTFGLLGWSRDEILEFLVDVKKEVMDTSIHAYFPVTFVYGRKPLDAA